MERMASGFMALHGDEGSAGDSLREFFFSLRVLKVPGGSIRVFHLEGKSLIMSGFNL